MRRPPNKARVASLHEDAYKLFVELLVRRRISAGLSQQAVADALGWNQSIVAKIETAQRRVDVIELLRLADIIGFDCAKLVQEIKKAMIRSGDLGN